jgi:hypothetical protein
VSWIQPPGVKETHMTIDVDGVKYSDRRTFMEHVYRMSVDLNNQDFKDWITREGGPRDSKRIEVLKEVRNHLGESGFSHWLREEIGCE